ncbi:MAG TPA: SgcJ/EcaC family oxidoreductase [Polyangiaceae bacterium]|nr:SgcJ/EcaC family oxidoreductase [Polyangiaceae bacterium]
MPTRRCLALLLLAHPLLGCDGRSQAAIEGPPAEASIRQALAGQADAWNRHDAKAWSASFADDADFVNVLGMLFQGRAEIERRHADLFGSIFARSQVVVTTRKVRSVGKTAAVAETDHELRNYDRLPDGIRPTDADGTLRTRLKYDWELTPSGWRIVSAQNTAVLPLPG